MTSSGLQSLDELATLAETERMMQIGHFEALDGKAGIVLGFAGALVALAPDVSRLRSGRRCRRGRDRRHLRVADVPIA